MSRVTWSVLAAIALLIAGLAIIGFGISTRASAATTCGQHTAAFGWEANRLVNDGANLVLPVTQAMTIEHVTVDYSMTLSPGATAGWHEALVYMALNPTSAPGPAFQPVTAASPGWGASSRQGTASHGGGMSDDLFAQAILKNGYAGQLVSEDLSYPAVAGSRLFVHADAVGAPVDVEAQGTVTYQVCS